MITLVSIDIDSTQKMTNAEDTSYLDVTGDIYIAFKRAVFQMWQPSLPRIDLYQDSFSGINVHILNWITFNPSMDK